VTLFDQMSELLKCLVCASLKAANIARACRAEPALFELLVEEKTGDDKNAKFDQDFKTLADVLIQETVRHDVSCMFPGLQDNIFGEESNKFTNKLGESLVVAVQADENATKELLTKVLNDNDEAAKLLAKQVHAKVTVDDDKNEEIEVVKESVNIDDIGIWIDPIDATSQYIKGVDDDVSETDLPTKGLQVVTVLIGAFLKSTGQPIIGVVSHPFSGDQVRVCWGVTMGHQVYVSGSVGSKRERSKPRLLIGSSENKTLVEKLSEEFEVVKVGGAGHKLMMVALGSADIYINTGASTFKWDSCGPHTILAGLGGGVVDCKDFQDIRYDVTEGGSKANVDGIVAFKEEKYLDIVKKIISLL